MTMKDDSFIPLIFSTFVLLLPGNIFIRHGPLVSGHNARPRISTRLAQSVCEQQSQFSTSRVVQRPVKSAPLDGGVGSIPCGWINWRLSSSSHPDAFTTCQQMKRMTPDGEMETEKGDHKEMEGRIVGGHDAKPHEFPYIVSIGYNRYHDCGGSIINEYWVLTASHCQIGMGNTVVAGEHHRQVDEGTEQVRKIALWLPPPRNPPGPEEHDNDVSMLKVDQPFVFNEYVQPIALPPSDFVPQGIVKIAGWGLTRSQGQPNSSLADVLQTTPIPVIPNKECQELIDNNTEYQSPRIYSSDVCIGWEDGRANSCHGDSGGPMVTTIDGKITLLGFCIDNSGGRFNCSGAGYPNIYKRVSFPYYLEYIAKSIAEN